MSMKCHPLHMYRFSCVSRSLKIEVWRYNVLRWRSSAILNLQHLIFLTSGSHFGQYLHISEKFLQYEQSALSVMAKTVFSNMTILNLKILSFGYKYFSLQSQSVSACKI